MKLLLENTITTLEFEGKNNVTATNTKINTQFFELHYLLIYLRTFQSA